LKASLYSITPLCCRAL